MNAALRYLWAGPCSVLGLALAMPILLTGGRSKVAQGVLEVAWPDPPRPAKNNIESARIQPLSWLPFCAITFGHVVLGRSHAELAQLRAHEHAHVRQYERWGLLFLLLYPAASVWQWWRGGKPYWDNIFEVDARKQAQAKVEALADAQAEEDG